MAEDQKKYFQTDDEIEEISHYIDEFSSSASGEAGLDIDMKADEEKEKDNGRSIGYEIFTWIRDLSIVIVVVLLMTTFVGEKIRVIGASMEPNVHDGDHFLLDKISYRVGEPERYDVIAFPYDDKVNYIKRIIGLPNEEVNIILGDDESYEVYIDGVLLDDPYGMEAIIRPGNQKYPLIVPEGEYFVLGDNRNDSSDSRYMDVGTVEVDTILGKTFIRIWPFKDFGFVE